MATRRRQTGWREGKRGWVYRDAREPGYWITKRSVNTVPRAERWLAHLAEKNWARPTLPEMTRRFSSHLDGRPVRIMSHQQLNAEHGFHYGNTL